MIKKRKLLKVSFTVAASAMLLTACGNTAEPATSNTVISTTAVENVSTEAPQEETESVCAHEWKEATYAEPKTCTLCGETEGEPKQTYFEEHGAQVKDAPVDCTVDRVIYNPDNLEQQMVTDVTWQQLDCYSEPAEEDGYQFVRLELLASSQGYYNSANNINYTGGFMTQRCYDWYTGRALPTRSTSGEDTVEYTVTIDIDDVSYDVSYTQDVEWENGEWTADASGDAYYDSLGYVTYTFKIPEGYDGLVFAAIPLTEYNEEDYDYENIDESEQYAFDDDACPEGTVFFRINKEGMAPLRQIEE